MLYVKLKKALYSTIKAALLLCQFLSKSLMAWSFKLKKYDPFAVNKTINGRQCTIIWHVSTKMK